MRELKQQINSQVPREYLSYTIALVLYLFSYNLVCQPSQLNKMLPLFLQTTDKFYF